jgi:hypothetical protein
MIVAGSQVRVWKRHPAAPGELGGDEAHDDAGGGGETLPGHERCERAGTPPSASRIAIVTAIVHDTPAKPYTPTAARAR